MTTRYFLRYYCCFVVKPLVHGYVIKSSEKTFTSRWQLTAKVFNRVFLGPAAVGNHAFVTTRETKDSELASG